MILVNDVNELRNALLCSSDTLCDPLHKGVVPLFETRLRLKESVQLRLTTWHSAKVVFSQALVGELENFFKFRFEHEVV